MRTTGAISRILLAAVSAAALAGCAPDLGAKPELQSPASLSSPQSFAAPAAAWPSEDWWTQFHDPELSALIEEGLKGTPDLAIAEARMREAEAQAQQAGAAQWPSLEGSASALPTKPNVNNGFPAFIKPLLPHSWHTEISTSLALNYDVDFWGKNRAALAAATSQAQAAEIEATEARLTLATSIATSYAALVQLNADLKTQHDAVRVRKESADLVASQVQHGLENEGQLAQARAEIAIAQGQEDALRNQIEHTRHQIAALLGKGPDRGLSILPAETVAPLPLGLPPSLPADLVGRRADIVAARLEAEAAAQRIDVAEAAYYPDVNLSAMIGVESLNPSDFLKKGSILGSVGPAVHLPIFTGGQIEGTYRGARASYDEAVANYGKTLVHAFEDVADAISDRKSLTVELQDARLALKESEKAYEVAKIRYRGGLSRYQDVLTAENTVLLQRRQLTDLQTQGFAQTIALIRALGGGFAVTTLASNNP